MTHKIENLHLPFSDFFTKFSERNSIYKFGEESRLAALENVTKFRHAIDIGAHVGISVLHWKKLFERVGRCIRRVHEVEGSEYHLSCSLTRFKISVLLLVYCSEDFRLLPVCNTFRMVASFQYSMH